MTDTNPIPTQPETLSPCPLFGHLPDKGEFTNGPYIAVSGAPDMPKFYAIVCPGCCSTAYDENKERVVKKWNTRAAVTAPRGDVIHWKLKAGVAEAMCGAAIKGNATLISDWATCEKCKVAAFGYQIGRADERAATSSPTPADVQAVADRVNAGVDQMDKSQSVDAATMQIQFNPAPPESTRVEGEQE